jgi:uncharacterized protein (TIGR03067 family)
MKRLMFIGLIAAAVANLSAAAASDNQSLEGEWIPAKAELGGKAMPETVLKTISLKLSAGTYDVSAGGEPDKGTYEIDSTTTPKSMIIKGTAGPNKGRTIPAIYEMEGKTLRICYDLSGKQRPKDFKSIAGTRLYLISYQRRE